MHSAIFEGWVRHRRTEPVVNEFRYRLFMMYLDLQELPKLFSGRWFWSAERSALARFRREDHLGDPNKPLDSEVRELIEERIGRRPEGPIRILTQLSYFGYCFNPVSFYYCFDLSGRRLEAIVAEVNNTPWGERHCYVLDACESPALRFRFAKEFHVSPFMTLDMRYDWKFAEPGSVLLVQMDNEKEGKFFDATMVLNRKEISGASLASVLIGYPFMTLRIVAAIHFQALRLWLKRCPFIPHPHARRSKVGVPA